MPLNENNTIPGLKQIYHKESFFLQSLLSHIYDDGNIFELHLRLSSHCVCLREKSLLFLHRKNKNSY